MDHGILNVPLAKRGNIDAQIDAYKADLAKLAKEETIRPLRNGMAHLCKGDLPRVFSSASQAEKAAQRTGGEAYQSTQSNRFLVRFPA